MEKADARPHRFWKPQDDHDTATENLRQKSTCRKPMHMIIENTYKSEIQIRMRVVRLAEELRPTRAPTNQHHYGGTALMPVMMARSERSITIGGYRQLCVNVVFGSRGLSRVVQEAQQAYYVAFFLYQLLRFK
jgi:hypothetical protein